MKLTVLSTLLFGLLLYGCNHAGKADPSKKNVSTIANMPNQDKDLTEIRNLIRQALKWADSKNVIQLLPALSKDSLCTGFDFDTVNQNLEKLRQTGFFADEFIDNYDRIMHTLDKKIKNKEFGAWNVYELPTFNFANDVDPWCSCQDNMSWGNVEVEPIKLSNNKGELTWNWGKLDATVDKSWKSFSYNFRVVKVHNKWKISYMEGFDYNESIK